MTTCLHTVNIELRMRTGGKVEMHLVQANAAEVLEWLAPMLGYLKTMAAEERPTPQAGEQEQP